MTVVAIRGGSHNCDGLALGASWRELGQESAEPGPQWNQTWSFELSCQMIIRVIAIKPELAEFCNYSRREGLIDSGTTILQGCVKGPEC